MICKHINKAYVFSRLSSIRLFWSVRDRLKKLDFCRQKTDYNIREKLNNTVASINIIWNVTKNSLPLVILSLIVAVMLCISEYYIDFFKTITIFDKIASHTSIDKITYTQMLVAISSVIGIFIGLYFAAVGNVLSSTYSLVPAKLRDIVMKHTIKNGYINFVAFLIALSLVLLGLCSIGIQPIHFAIPMLIILTCVAVFAFIELFRGAFKLADPSTLLGPLRYDLMKWVRLSTSNGRRWRNKDFQNYYRIKAYEIVTAMTSLAKISSEKRELQIESFSRILRHMLFTMGEYHNEKSLIPSDSNWFGKKLKHQQWYLSDSSRLEMATQTSSPLSPIEIPDISWVEDSILGVVFDAYCTDLRANDFDSLFRKLSDLPDILNNMGKNWLIDDGKKWNLKLADEIVNSICATKLDNNTQDLNTVAVMEIVASLPISLELGFINSVNDINLDNLRAKLLRTKWSKAKSPYKFLLPLETIKNLEQIQDGVKFEKSVKSPHKTQGWYVIELIYNNLDWFIFSQWNNLINFFESWYKKAGEQLSSAKRYNDSATVYARAIEQAWRLTKHIEQLKTTSEALRNNTKLDFKRPEWDWMNERRRVNAFRDLAIDGMATLIPNLLQDEKPSEYIPDLFGGAVHYVGEACFNALVDGDANRFSKLFKLYFIGILGVFDRVRPQVKGWDISTAVTWMSEPIIDLLNISGYAYIFAEYHNKVDIWNDCKSVWDTYMKIEAAPQQLETLAALSKHHKNLFGTIAPRDTLRSRWQIDLANLLNSLPRQNVDNNYFTRSPIDHLSEFIRNIAPFDGSMPFMSVDAMDVFIVKYLFERQDSSGLDFGVSLDTIKQINRHEGNDHAQNI